jgi:hypothetical protein
MRKSSRGLVPRAVVAEAVFRHDERLVLDNRLVTPQDIESP